MLWQMIIPSVGALFTASIAAYFEPNSGFTIPGIILWTILDIFVLVQFFSLTNFGLILLVMTTTYIKYKYNEINDKIHSSIKRGKHSLLKEAMNEHNIITQMVVKINIFFKFALFCIYYLTTIGFELMLYQWTDTYL